MKLDIEQLPNDSDGNPDLYEAMRQRLAKKGLLRKLIDNLVSHRNKIYDSLNHNYEIVLQNNKLENKYAGLLIIDQIIEGVYQSLKTSRRSFNYVSGDELGEASESQNPANIIDSSNANKPSNMQQVLGEGILGDKPRKLSRLEAAMQGNPLIR